MLWCAAMGFACNGGQGGITVSGPGPGSDEPPFPPLQPGGDTFGGNCEPLVSCESLEATCGEVLDNCGNPLNCNNGEQDGDETDVDCGGGGNCDQLCVSGQMCEVPEDCEDGFCSDEICCDEDCTAICMTCELGSCQPIQQNTEDPGECEMTMACDGNGECKLVAGEACTTDDECVSGTCDTTNTMTCF
jgi:hypothetical protein